MPQLRATGTSVSDFSITNTVNMGRQESLLKKYHTTLLEIILE